MASTGAPDEPRLVMRKIYVKDLSYESPNSPDIFQVEGAQDTRPTMRVQVAKSHTALDNDEYELVLRITVHAILDDGNTLFLIEISQAGIFWLPDQSGESLDRALNVDCQRTLYPFAREALWTAITRGGLPPLLLQDIDFDALHEQVYE